MKKFKFPMLILLLLSYMFALTSCADKSAGISILSDSDTFFQSTSVNNKIDIMWMVDTSGSMAPYQQKLADNFSDFISDFVTKGYDFNMAVGGTDAWIREKNYVHTTCGSSNASGNPNTQYYSSSDCNSTLATYGQLTHFRDGDIYDGTVGAGTRSGNYLITSLMNTADILSTFAKNIKVGIRGDGAERGFASIRASLRRNDDGTEGYSGETHTSLAGFRRSGAFLAVIVVADEEDGSRKPDNTVYASTAEYTSSFVSFLDGYTGSTAGNRKYNVSSIVVEDINNCPGHHVSASQGNKYMSIATEANGVIGSICDADFSTKLKEISSRIAELSNRFKLSREPIPASIRVKVNAVNIIESTTNGWTYVEEAGSHYIEFHGTALPQQGSAITVDFDPVSLE